MADSNLSRITKDEQHCKEIGCSNKHLGLGYCAKHYQYLKTRGLLISQQGTHCEVEGCETGVYAKNLCGLHYYRVLLRGTPDEPFTEFCTLKDCSEAHYGKGLCFIHYQREWLQKRRDNPKYKCKVEDCSTVMQVTTGYCQTHTKRLKLYGSPYNDGKPTIAERFWAKVNKTSNPNGCWEWQSAKTKLGYGRFSYNRKPHKAHRISYFLAHGVFPKLCILHSCDNPPCVNPAHLREGTHLDNQRDRHSRGRYRVNKTE